MKNNEKAIFAEVKVNASLDEVWEAWTTEEGIKSFLAPACKVDLRPDGAYEVYFNPDASEGERGGEGLRILSIQPMKMFSFTWNAPPTLPNVRGQRTHVILRFIPEEDGIRVTLHHGGWGSDGEWDQAFEYFQKAWNDVVLPRLRYRFEHGPVDWENPPSVETLASGSA